MAYTKDSVKTYTFGVLSFSVKNYRGVYFLSDSVKATIQGMTTEQAKEANKAAWKQKNSSARIINRTSNWSNPENHSPYEEASSLYDVAEQVAKATWKRMNGY